MYFVQPCCIKEESHVKRIIAAVCVALILVAAAPSGIAQWTPVAGHGDGEINAGHGDGELHAGHGDGEMGVRSRA
jgi:hypothetical protein